MFARSPSLRKLALAACAAAATALASCGPLPQGAGGGATGPRIDTSAPVPVALLLPSSGAGGGRAVAASMENAARLAASSIEGADIALTVYDTGGTPAGAAAAANRALADGAGIFVGPLYSQSISAVTPIVSAQNINVLSLSNNTAVAGGNIFVLGQTFEDIAERLTSYARGQGRRSVAIVHADDVSGNAGRDAIVSAANASGMQVATVQSYPLSQDGIVSAGPRIASAITQSGAQAVFLTANVDSDLPLIATALPENGVSPAQVQYMGLTRWNALPQALALPGVQGGIFALPDRSSVAAFEQRYQAAYSAAPHPLAGIAFDAVQAIGSLVADGNANALSARALTRSGGFQGAYGAFRLRPDGTNDRALAVARVENSRTVLVDPAPSGFGAFGF